METKRAEGEQGRGDELVMRLASSTFRSSLSKLIIALRNDMVAGGAVPARLADEAFLNGMVWSLADIIVRVGDFPQDASTLIAVRNHLIKAVAHLISEHGKNCFQVT